jgi:outer membrane protein insertion porin family
MVSLVAGEGEIELEQIRRNQEKNARPGLSGNRVVSFVGHPSSVSTGPRYAWTPRVGQLIAVVLISVIPNVALASTRADLDPAVKYKTARIDISGVRAFSPANLLAVMATKTRPEYQVWKALPKFDPQAFADDLEHIERYYWVHGYYNAQVSYELEIHGDRVTPHIQVQEGKPVTIAEVRTYGRSPPPSELDSSFTLPLKKGDVFEQSAYQIGEQNLLDLYTRHSYARAKAQRHAVVNSGSRLARVWYDIEPGSRCVFGKSLVVGTRKVDPKLVREQLTYKPGEPFDSRKLSKSRDAVVGLNLFSAVDFEKEDNRNNPGVVPIRIAVQEGPQHSVNAGVGYNTQTQLNAMIALNDYNFLGGGRQFSLSGTYSNIRNVLDAKLVQPRFISSKTSLTLEASQQQQTYQTYKANISGFDPHLDYQVSSSLVAFAGWRLEYLRFNSVNQSTIAAIGGFRRKGILSGPNAGITFNNTEDPFNPHSGEIVSIYGNISEHALGADYRYWRVTAEGRKYQLVGWKTVLATRFEVGLGDTLSRIGDVPLSERFYSGGEGSVRGYGLRRIGPLSLSNDPLGGLSRIEGSIELRRPLFAKLNGAIFFDCGQVATKPYDLRVDALQCGYGPAASYTTPVGPIRFDVGFPTQKPRGDGSWQFYFSIGQYF